MTIRIDRVDWLSEGPSLLAIRHRVFVDEQDVPPALEHDEYDADAIHLLARNDTGEPIATARLLTDGHIGRMAVLPEWRKQGIGRAMMHRLTDIAADHGLNRVFLHAQCQALPFYRRLGFSPEGDIFKDAGIDHRKMTMPVTPRNN